MHHNIRRGLLGTLFAGGLLALGSTAASAADNTTTGADGILSGTQVIAPVSIPINLGSTSLGLLGDSAATTGGNGHTAPAPAPATASTTGADGILSGTQVIAPITAPVSLGATSVGAIGDSTATTGGGQAATAPAPSAPAPAPAVSLGATSVGAIGDSTATTGGGQAATAPAPSAPAPAPAAPSTTGADGILSGTQVIAPITAPVSLGATSVGAIGDSAATTGGGQAGTTPPATASTGPSTTGADGILSGTQVIAPITAPISLGATSVGALGDSAATTGASGGTGHAAAGPGTGATTTGAGGILSGTQIVAPITAPISLGATSVGVGGGSTATTGNPPVITPPVINPPVVNPPVVAPPVVTPPVVNPPAVTTPETNTPGENPSAVQPQSQSLPVTAAQAVFPAAAGTLAYTGANVNALWLAGLFLGAGLLLMLGVRLKKA
jgi:hypothetical protein